MRRQPVYQAAPLGYMISPSESAIPMETKPDEAKENPGGPTMSL